MPTWTLWYFGQRNYFSSKVWATINLALIRRFLKVVILTNIFPHLFNFLSFSLVVCWEVCRVFDHSCTALCLKYASHKRFQKSIGYMALVNLQNLYHCLWKLSLLESHWIACIACFLGRRFLSFLLVRATWDPIVGLWVYIGHIFGL